MSKATIHSPKKLFRSDYYTYIYYTIKIDRINIFLPIMLYKFRCKGYYSFATVCLLLYLFLFHIFIYMFLGFSFLFLQVILVFSSLSFVDSPSVRWVPLAAGVLVATRWRRRCSCYYCGWVACLSTYLSNVCLAYLHKCYHIAICTTFFVVFFFTLHIFVATQHGKFSLRFCFAGTKIIKKQQQILWVGRLFAKISLPLLSLWPIFVLCC